jgi:hypothetical protein
MVAKTITKSLYGRSAFPSARDPGRRMRWIVFSNYILSEKGTRGRQTACQRRLDRAHVPPLVKGFARKEN